MDLDYAVYSVVAPMIFLILAKHSMGVCVQANFEMDPKKYIASQLATILHGMSAPAGETTHKPKKASA